VREEGTKGGAGGGGAGLTDSELIVGGGGGQKLIENIWPKVARQCTLVLPVQQFCRQSTLFGNR